MPNAGLEVGKYMGWGASVPSEPIQVAVVWMTAITGTDPFPFLWPAQITLSLTKTRHCGIQKRSGSIWIKRENKHKHVSEQCNKKKLHCRKKCSAAFRFDW